MEGILLLFAFNEFICVFSVPHDAFVTVSGELLLVTGGLVLYFGDMLALTIAKVGFCCILIIFSTS